MIRCMIQSPFNLYCMLVVRLYAYRLIQFQHNVQYSNFSDVLKFEIYMWNFLTAGSLTIQP
jgi:hypothetical protein